MNSQMVPTEAQEKKEAQRQYMREYMKKRRQEDPEFRAKLNEMCSKRNTQRRNEDDEFRKQGVRMTCQWSYNKWHNDAEYRARRLAEMKERYQLKKLAALSIVA